MAMLTPSLDLSGHGLPHFGIVGNLFIHGPLAEGLVLLSDDFEQVLQLLDVLLEALNDLL